MKRFNSIICVIYILVFLLNISLSYMIAFAADEKIYLGEWVNGFDPWVMDNDTVYILES